MKNVYVYFVLVRSTAEYKRRVRCILPIRPEVANLRGIGTGGFIRAQRGNSPGSWRWLGADRGTDSFIMDDFQATTDAEYKYSVC